MKKLLSFALLLIFVLPCFILTGCDEFSGNYKDAPAAQTIELLNGMDGFGYNQAVETNAKLEMIDNTGNILRTNAVYIMTAESSGVTAMSGAWDYYTKDGRTEKEQRVSGKIYHDGECMYYDIKQNGSAQKIKNTWGLATLSVFPNMNPLYYLEMQQYSSFSFYLKTYVASHNKTVKIKLSVKDNYSESEMIFVFEDSKLTAVKFASKTTVNLSGAGYKANATMKTVNKTVTLPNDLDAYESGNPYNF